MNDDSFGIRMKLDKIKSSFMDRQAVLSRFDRRSAKALARVGALTRTIARRRMKPGGRKARVSEFDNSLKALLGELRDKKTGRFKSQNEHDIRPWPKVASKPGQGPRAITRQLKDGIFFIADAKRRSVITGPQITGQYDVPGVLEAGGDVPGPFGYEREWVAFWSGGRRVIRLAGKGGKRIRLKARPYMEPAHDAAIDILIPGIWKDSI